MQTAHAASEDHRTKNLLIKEGQVTRYIYIKKIFFRGYIVPVVCFRFLLFSSPNNIFQKIVSKRGELSIEINRISFWISKIKIGWSYQSKSLPWLFVIGFLPYQQTILICLFFPIEAEISWNFSARYLFYCGALRSSLYFIIFFHYLSLLSHRHLHTSVANHLFFNKQRLSQDAVHNYAKLVWRGGYFTLVVNLQSRRVTFS